MKEESKTTLHIIKCPNCGNEHGSSANHICYNKDIIAVMERDCFGEQKFYIRIDCIDQNELDDLQSKLVGLRKEKRL